MVGFFEIKKNNYFGPLSWKGNRTDICILSEIPHHVNIKKGDTIVTSGHSAIFPEGILIGYVNNFWIKDGNFYEIEVKLAIDLKRLTNVTIIKNNFLILLTSRLITIIPVPMPDTATVDTIVWFLGDNWIKGRTQ